MLSKKFLSVIGVCVCAALVGCSEKKSAERPPLPVKTMTAVSETANRWVDTFGQAEGAHEVEVRAQVGGVLRSLHFVEGEAVKAGQTLFQIEPEPFVAAVKKARAQLQSANADLTRTKSDYDRAKKLIELKAISQKDYDTTLSQYRLAQSAQASARAQLDTAQIDLQHAKVPAPVSGFAGKSEVNIGSLVSAGSTLLTSITQPGELRVSFAVGDRDVAGVEVKKDYPVWIFVPGTDLRLPAKLDFVAKQVDADRGTLRMRAKLDPQAPLLPGQYVEVRLMVDKIEGAYRVPQGAVRQKADGTYAVYVVQDGQARERRVTVSHWEGKDWILTGGLKPNDQVIVNQLLRLRDRLAVSATPAEELQKADASAKAQKPAQALKAQ